LKKGTYRTDIAIGDLVEIIEAPILSLKMLMNLLSQIKGKIEKRDI